MSTDYQDAALLQKQKEMYLDEKDFLAQFILNPNIQEESDYKHLDKNLSITRLSSRYQEPEKARAILRALHVLSNPKYFREVRKTVFAGYDEKEANKQVCKSCGKTTLTNEGIKKCSCGAELPEGEWVIIKTPVYEQKNIKETYYPKAYHALKSAFYSLTTTAAARDGHLLRGMKTTRFERSDSIEDKTESKQKFNWFQGRSKR